VNHRRPALLAALPLLVSLSLPLSGCYGDVESFAKKAAKHSCKRLRECDQTVFDEEYGGDLERCRDSQYTDFLDAADLAEELGCDYVSDEAKQCDATIRDLKNECGDEADQDIADACEEVYDCPIGLELEPPTGLPTFVGGGLASWPEDAPPSP
jgi:sugar phosphate isomerase/epimerase